MLPVLRVSLLLFLLQNIAQEPYFPKLSLGSSAGDRMKPSWYGAQLRGLEEPPLPPLMKDQTAEVYRFLWLRSFHHPVAIRLERRPDGTGALTTKMGSGAGGYAPESILATKASTLTREQTQEFLSRVTQVHFWSLPNPVNDQKGTDGSQWIVEGVRNGQYHVVDRWSPTTGAVRELGEDLAFHLAGLQVPENAIY